MNELMEFVPVRRAEMRSSNSPFVSLAFSPPATGCDVPFGVRRNY